MFRRKTDLESLRAERRVIVEQLDQVRQDAAWCRASDDPYELQEARRWQAQADALQRSLDALDMRIMKEELDRL